MRIGRTGSNSVDAAVSGTFRITIRLIRFYFLGTDRGDIVAHGNAVLGINVLRCQARTVYVYMREFPTLQGMVHVNCKTLQ